MLARHPDIAKRWRKESGPQRGLPERTKRKGDERRTQLVRAFMERQRRGR